MCFICRKQGSGTSKATPNNTGQDPGSLSHEMPKQASSDPVHKDTTDGGDKLSSTTVEQPKVVTLTLHANNSA